MKKLVSIFLIFFTLVLFQIFINQNEKSKLLSQKIKKCNDLSYESHILNKSQMIKKMSEKVELKIRKKI